MTRVKQNYRQICNNNVNNKVYYCYFKNYYLKGMSRLTCNEYFVILLAKVKKKTNKQKKKSLCLCGWVLLLLIPLVLSGNFNVASLEV